MLFYVKLASIFYLIVCFSFMANLLINTNEIEIYLSLTIGMRHSILLRVQLLST